MSQARWMCRLCNTWGLGGPHGAATHVRSAHGGSSGTAVYTGFGFTGKSVAAARYKSANPAVSPTATSTRSTT